MRTVARQWPAADAAPRILHVTESLAAGVGKSLSRLVQRQQEAGADCTVLAVRRYDTPAEDELRRWMGPDVRLLLPDEAVHGRAQLLWLAARLVRELRTGSYDVVHLHSSFAGAIGRLVGVPLIAPSRVFYSPHGLAFLRRDLSIPMRRTILLIERLLAHLGGSVVAVSESERRLVSRRLTTRVRVLPNGVDTRRLPPRAEAHEPRPTVAMLGRVAFQKAPWRFASVAAQLADEADFVWLGYGEDPDVDRWLGSAPVELSGPLEHTALLERLAQVDLVYFPTLWEAMPMSLIEAQALGVPCVVSDVDGNRDVVEDGTTGLVRHGEAQLVEALAELLHDPEMRIRMGDAAAERVLREFSDADLGSRSLELYADVLTSSSSSEAAPRSQVRPRRPTGRVSGARVTG
jgi:glycosyltransferase involved in cell wall biosynthesis